jgi:hypothetical protein
VRQHTLMNMKAEKYKTIHPRPQADIHRQLKDTVKNNDFSGYPTYPASDDIYSKYQEEKDINPEDISKLKESNDKIRTYTEKDFNNDHSGNDLDVPGAELDDNQEKIGSEDEENNYYSIGGDDHNELEEDNGY